MSSGAKVESRERGRPTSHRVSYLTILYLQLIAVVARHATCGLRSYSADRMDVFYRPLPNRINCRVVDVTLQRRWPKECMCALVDMDCAFDRSAQ